MTGSFLYKNNIHRYELWIVLSNVCAQFESFLYSIICLKIILFCILHHTFVLSWPIKLSAPGKYYRGGGLSM